MTRVLLVDWLGRGGIAQTSEAWAIELGDAATKVRVVTRLGRELGAGAVDVVGPRERRSSVLSHAALCRRAAREIRTFGPDVVVVQNYVLPVLEEQVHRAARAVGAELVFVIHDHRHHEWREGSHLGLERQIRRADQVVVHSKSVRDGLPRDDARFVPHPVPLGLLAAEGTSPIHHEADDLLALHVGVLNRSYKGVDTTLALAAGGVAGWSFALAGVGAPECPSAQSVDRFLEPGELIAAVRTADAVVLPYRTATQSGVPPLAHLCGSVPVVAAVGGLAEQVEDGVTGLVLAADAGPDAWRERLSDLRDPVLRASIRRAGEAAVWRRHDAFRDGVREIVGYAPTGSSTPTTSR